MFKRWSVITNNTAIARFMREGIDPTKEYTKREIMELCNEYNLRLGNITKKNNNNHTIGEVMYQKNRNIYCLHPKLIQKFNQYF
jgi:hypothetical protein